MPKKSIQPAWNINCNTPLKERLADAYNSFLLTVRPFNTNITFLHKSIIQRHICVCVCVRMCNHLVKLFCGFFVVLSKMLPLHPKCHALKAENVFCSTLWSTISSTTKTKGSSIKFAGLQQKVCRNSAQSCLGNLDKPICLFGRWYVHEIISKNNGPGRCRRHISLCNDWVLTSIVETRTKTTRLLTTGDNLIIFSWHSLHKQTLIFVSC